MSEDFLPKTHSRSHAKTHFASRLQSYRDLLIRRWWVLALGALLGGAVEIGLWFFEAPSFVSFGRMIVSIKLAIPEGSVYNEELGNFLGTQAALMQSGGVLNRAHLRVVTQNGRFTNQPVALKVAVSPKTSIFVLQASGHEPAYVQAFLQACMEEYISLKREMRTRTSDTTVAGLTEEILRLEKDLRRGEEDLAAFQRSNSVVLLQEQGNSAGNYLAALNQRLAVFKSEYDLLQTLTLEQNLERRQEVSANLPLAALPADPAAPAANPGDRVDGDYLKAKQQVQLLKAEKEEMGQYLREKHPKMIALQEEIGRRERLLEIFRQQSAEQLENRKASLALQIQNLEKEVGEWDTRALDISRKTAEFVRLKAGTQRTQALYDRLLATMQTLDVNKGVSPESVTIMEPASQALPDKPQRTRELFIAGLLAVVLSIGLLLFLDHLDDRINSFTELQDLFDETVLAQIPREKDLGARGRNELLGVKDPRHTLVEAYRNLRSSLLYISEGNQRPKTLLLTSSVPNEGKSVTSGNLAITLARAGSKVLLVDADLRKGVLHNLFDLDVGTGLSDVLANGADWQEVVQPTGIPNLWLLPCGTVAHNSSELFLAPATEQFLKTAIQQYDFVLLDTPPVMAADDATSLAPHADSVLFVLRSEHTSARVARAALELLYQRQARILGIIFNAVRRGSADYHYYKYGDYYIQYGEAKTQV